MGKLAEAGERWEHFPHGADIGIRGIGGSLEQAFAQAARAMTAAMVNPDIIRAEIPVEIRCAGKNIEDLLYVWLNAVIYEMATRRMIFGRFHVEIGDIALKATAWGEHIHPDRHEPAVEIKGATFTALSVHREHGLWIAQCVVDV